MNTSVPLDWSLIQSILAVAEAGSLSAAARRLGLSQPTLGRQIQAAEAVLGVTLFQRHARGLELTDTGLSLIEPARAMQDAAARLSLLAAGRETTLSGTVRITASVVMAHHILPPLLARLRTAEPQIEIELVASDATENLLYREADIAIRMYRPTDPNLIARHVGDSALGFFAAQSYLDRRGTPSSLDDLWQHDWLGFDRSTLMIEGFRNFGMTVDRHFFGLRTDDQAALWSLAQAGCGITVAQLYIGRSTPGMVQLLPDTSLPLLPIWLTAAEPLRRTPRIRRVWDALAEGLAQVASA